MIISLYEPLADHPRLNFFLNFFEFNNQSFRFSISAARKTLRRILPEALTGTRSTNSNSAMRLNSDKLEQVKSINSEALIVWLGWRSWTNALGTSPLLASGTPITHA